MALMKEDSELRAHIRDRDKALAEAQETLRFYAGEGCDNRRDFYVNRIIADKGEKARAWLLAHPAPKGGLR
jgi:hypothetical protein